MTAVTTSPPNGRHVIATAPAAPTPATGLAGRLGWAVRDTLVLAGRHLRHIPRVPEKLTGQTIQPIMFVLLFAYVFGSAIDVSDGSYREFLMGGIFVQTTLFAAMITAPGVADDMRKGLIDRFRSLPMARSAVLGGRALADLLESMLGMAVMVGAGLIVGWRIRGTLGETMAAFGLLLLAGFTMIWVGALIGMLVRTPETTLTWGFIVLFPLTFLANTFVPTEGMPTVLRTFADWNPVSSTTLAVRELFGNPVGNPSDVWPMQHPILAAVLVWGALLVIVAPLAVRRYRSAVSR